MDADEAADLPPTRFARIVRYALFSYRFDLLSPATTHVGECDLIWPPGGVAFMQCHRRSSFSWVDVKPFGGNLRGVCVGRR